MPRRNRTTPPVENEPDNDQVDSPDEISDLAVDDAPPDSTVDEITDDDQEQPEGEVNTENKQYKYVCAESFVLPIGGYQVPYAKGEVISDPLHVLHAKRQSKPVEKREV